MRWTDEENVTHACRVLDEELTVALKRGLDSFKIDSWTKIREDEGDHVVIEISPTPVRAPYVPKHATLCGRVCDAADGNTPITCFRCLHVIELTGPLDEKGVPWISV